MDLRLHNELAEIIEWFPDGVYVVDGECRTLLVNSAYEELSGSNREDLIGRTMTDLTEDGFFNQSVSVLVRETKRPMSLMQTLKNGKEVIVTGNPVLDDKGRIQLIVTSVRDITHLNRVTAELEKAIGLSELNKHQYHVALERGPKVIAKSKQMQEVVNRVKQVAPFPTSVLISGPSGVGKEVIANCIHDLSQRSQKPFIKVNCAAIPDALLESELFGYEPGAFTGARRDGKAGLFELADGGTILLDEIGDMPPSIQAKLLRVLQDLTVLRVGGTRPRSVDVRVISATNQDLRKLVQDGRFREDLYYRLQVVEVRIPPLSQRPQDAIALIEHYFHYYCTKYRVAKRLRQDTVDTLHQYPWPGNVRELKNLMENLVVSVPSLTIEPHHLPIHVQSRQDTKRARSLKQRLDRFEQQVVMEALSQHGSFRKAAEALGVDHSTLVKKVKRWTENPPIA
ncbi:sigma 54-interacting transcriptional regulator [Alicyclobacillus fastidiosus]|uniref:HTH-type transcriptional regulatory protein TyrR n=1 Tax=Alicyclobacillus fastidiosus TaxID=392011 RepID=A0ABY6ZF27_9BACL|nr:sigma 54-interacting transcriptional regulator [Alicyclobacillus fastidiosus]WAH41163.1 sigma 54-interacting transcriptional regulator [Alicyclobacillus fastidiosus]